MAHRGARRSRLGSKYLLQTISSSPLGRPAFKFVAEIVPGYFLYDEHDPAKPITTTLPTSFGLLDVGPDRWARFTAKYSRWDGMEKRDCCQGQMWHRVLHVREALFQE
ncbi:hypothetical protein FRB94_003700 [Tulasnella sp. JGI-2019a]|nr:hypothetical protein FRB94_003700 [Tulasnella sp. JGI-2019a]